MLMKTHEKNSYDTPVTEVIKVEITPIMQPSNPDIGGGGSGSGNDDNPED